MNMQSDLTEEFQNDEIHDQWESVYRRGSLQRRLNKKIMNRFARWLQLKPGARVLDAGCGTGEHLLRLAQHGYQCVGVDLSQNILEKAREQARTRGLSSMVSFVCCGLEDLSLIDAPFDGIHCRGVLMHIPRYQYAIAELCRLLKPGGRIVIVENNQTSLETGIVRLTRRLRRSTSDMVVTDGGLEFHCHAPDEAPLSRIANIQTLCRELSEYGVRTVTRFSTEFWDINRFPAGLPRTMAQLFNFGWLSCHGPADWSSGNAIIGEKLR